MFTDNKNQTITGNQLIDNTNIQQSQMSDNNMTGEIYTMPKADGHVKPVRAKSSPKLLFIIISIIIIAIVSVGFWFYSTMRVPEDNLLIDQNFDNNLVLPDANKIEVPEEISSTPADRDVQRLEDIASIRSALALYYQEMKAYPDIIDDLLDNYLDTIPINPNPGGNSYVYIPRDSNQSYKLTFTLEDGGLVGSLTLKGGEYQAGPSMIQPLVEDTEEKGVEDNSDSEIELLFGLDTDEDGLTDIEENLYATDSTLVDSDADGYSDASELVNLYDPALPATLLSDTEKVTQYINTAYNYSILYPSAWTVRALTEDKMEIIFNSKTTEFVQILVLENPLGLSAKNWYLSNNKDTKAGDLNEILLNNIVGVQTGNNRYVYLGVGSNIYSIIYNVGTTNQLNYQSTYEMMLNSWELITVDKNILAVDRDTQRLKDITDIRFALLEYQVANLSFPDTLDSDVNTYQMIGTSTNDCAVACDNISTSSQCVDLSTTLIPDYITNVPRDPLDGTDENTRYYVNVLIDGTLIAGVCQAEDMAKIELDN